MSSEYVIVLTTFPDQLGAEKLAGELVTNQLAACVNILPKMVSIYEWQEKLEKGQEHQMVIKTRSQLVPKIEQLISKQHPYELAELLVLPVVSGSKDFLTWITETTHEKQQTKQIVLPEKQWVQLDFSCPNSNLLGQFYGIG